MPFDHEAVAALPAAGAANKTLLRGLLAGRMIYALDDAEDPEEFVAVDAATADIAPALIWEQKLWYLDSADTTTIHDGLTCLVSSDGKRYKYSGTNFNVASVLDKDLTAPPGSPSLGDAYIVAAAATGDWNGQDETIAVYTGQGWRFETPAIGRRVLVEDEDVYYRYNTASAWVLDSPLGANVVVPSYILGGRTHWTVENQTTNTPPTITAGTAYIIGGSPTGAWAGHAAKIAIGNAAADAWIIVAPAEGWSAYDKALNTPYLYTGSAWQAAGGSYLARSEATAAASTGNLGLNGTGYTYSDSSAPTTSAGAVREEALTVSHQALATGRSLEVEYIAVLSTGTVVGGADTVTVALFLDSETTARDWLLAIKAVTSSGKWLLYVPLLITAPDASAHTFKIRILFSGSGWTTGSNVIQLARRRLIVREAA